MKTLSKLVVVIYSSIFIFSSSSFAQENGYIPKESVVKKAYEVCPASLSSNIQGIVEASIYNIILLKKYYSSADYSRIIEKLNKIAEENIDLSIRYKAHLASLYLSFSDVIDVYPIAKTFDQEYIYKQISAQLENKIALSRN